MGNKLKYFSALLLITIIFQTSSFIGHSQAISARAFFDSTQIMLGDQIFFNLEIYQPKEARIFLPDLKDTLSSKIEILKAIPADTLIDNDDQLKITSRYLITSFDAGEHEIPSLHILFEFMGHSDTLITARASLTVNSPEIDESKDIFDIKPPFELPLTFIELLPYILLFFFLLAGVYVLFYFIRWNRKKKEIEKTILIETAHEIALRELDNLKYEALWQKNQVKLYYTKLTDILRKYLENRFGLRAKESTSNEILATLPEFIGDTENDLELIRDILLKADMVKFAKYSPEPYENERCFENAVLFILETKYEEPVSETKDMNGLENK